MRIDFHADDFGLTKSANSNILDTWRYGAINGVSLIANGYALHNAVNQIKRDMNRKLRLAVHLNLIDGPPIANPSTFRFLLNDHGQFRYGFLGLWSLWRSLNASSQKAFLKEIEFEWQEQIELVRKACSPRSITALDSHDHVHMLPFLFPIAAKLASKFNLPEIRISQEIFHISLKESIQISFPAHIAKHLLLNILSRSAKSVIKKYNIISPDAIIGVLYSSRMTRDTIMSGLRTARRKRINWLEIIFHPGRSTPDDSRRWVGKQTAARFHMSPHRDTERDALITISANHNNGINTGSFIE